MATSPALPIPPALWARILAFCQDGHTGRITLHIKQGAVLSFELTECGRTDALAEEPRALVRVAGRER